MHTYCIVYYFSSMMMTLNVSAPALTTNKLLLQKGTNFLNVDIRISDSNVK